MRAAPWSKSAFGSIAGPRFVLEREVDELAGGVLVRAAAFGFDRLAQLPVQGFDRVE